MHKKFVILPFQGMELVIRKLVEKIAPRNNRIRLEHAIKLKLNSFACALTLVVLKVLEENFKLKFKFIWIR